MRKLTKRKKELLEIMFKARLVDEDCELEIGTPFDVSVTQAFVKNRYDIEFSMWWTFVYPIDEDGCRESFKTENGINNVKIPCDNPDEMTTNDLVEILSSYILEETIKSFEDRSVDYNDNVPF